MRALKFVLSGRLKTAAFALAILTFFCSSSFAATDWSAIQSALGANGTEFPGNVLRFELSRQDLTVAVNGQPVNQSEVAAITNGYVAFKPVLGGALFFRRRLTAGAGVGAIRA